MYFNLYAAKKKVQLFPGLGIYSGIFAIYLHCVLSKEPRTRSIVLYALCLLYILSTATVVCDLLVYILPIQLQTLSHVTTVQLQTLSRITTVQIIVIGCCDFIAQCTLVRYKPLYLSSVLFT